jgi:hypothetical protein
MRRWSGTFTSADVDGDPQGLPVTDCVAQKIDLRGGTFMSSGTYTTGSVSLQYSQNGSTGWTNIYDHTTNDVDGPMTVCYPFIRIRTSADFTGSVNWILLIPERSEI